MEAIAGDIDELVPEAYFRQYGEADPMQKVQANQDPVFAGEGLDDGYIPRRGWAPGDESGPR